MVHGMALWFMVWHYGSWYGTIAHGMVLWFMVWHYDTWYGTIDHGIALWFMEWLYGSWYISLVQDHVHGIAQLVGHYVSW